MKKITFVLASLMILGSVLAGCKQADNQPAPQQTPSQTTPAKPGEQPKQP